MLKIWRRSYNKNAWAMESRSYECFTCKRRRWTRFSTKKTTNPANIPWGSDGGLWFLVAFGAITLTGFCLFWVCWGPLQEAEGFSQFYIWIGWPRHLRALRATAINAVKLSILIVGGHVCFEEDTWQSNTVFSFWWVTIQYVTDKICDVYFFVVGTMRIIL